MEHMTSWSRCLSLIRCSDLNTECSKHVHTLHRSYGIMAMYMYTHKSYKILVMDIHNDRRPPNRQALMGALTKGFRYM